MLSILIFSLLELATCYHYETHFYQQKIDHFGYSNQDTFQQRYLFSDAYWSKNGPIFFYTGNEGDITMFANNTGIMWEFAKEFKALVIFAEHRYYGQSLPYGAKSFQSLSYVGYLTSEQALADFAALVKYLKKTLPGGNTSPVIAFGGSYGGMLSAWMRIKYPHIITGALASSGPLFQFTDLTPCHVFYQIITRDFQKSSTNCAKSIRNSWSAIQHIGKTDKGCKWLTKNFHLCEQLTPETVQNLIDWFSETWSFLAMTDYPYPTDFLVPLPAYPINATCQNLKNPSKPDNLLLQDIMKAVSVFHNYTGNVQCFDLSSSGGSSLGENGWDFQSCTEMVMPLCSDGINDMFMPSAWNLTLRTIECRKKWGVTPEPYKAELIYGGKNITAASNIIFSNGLLDPWSGGGLLKSLSDSLIAIVMPDAAHHLDLRASNANDPISVVNARNLERKIIKEWISQK